MSCAMFELTILSYDVDGPLNAYRKKLMLASSS